MIDRSKRKFLYTTATLCLGAGIAPTVMLERTEQISMGLTEARLLSSLLALLPDQHSDSAFEVGRAVIQSGHVPSKPDLLLVDILTRLKLSADAVLKLQSQDLATAYFNRVLLDFDHGDTFKVSGWVLSQTEALLTALKTFHS